MIFFRYYDTTDNSTIKTPKSAEKKSTPTSTEQTISTSEATIIVKKDEIVLKPIVDPKVGINQLVRRVCFETANSLYIFF